MSHGSSTLFETLLHPSPDTTCGYFIIPYFIFRSFEKATLRGYRSKDGHYNIQLVETHINSFCRVQEFFVILILRIEVSLIWRGAGSLQYCHSMPAHRGPAWRSGYKSEVSP